MAESKAIASNGIGHLRLLGQFSLIDKSGSLQTVDAKKCRALLAYLAMHANEMFDREYLAHLLWEQRGDRLARQNLRQCKLVLSQALDQAFPGLFLESKESLGIAAGVLETDVLQVLQLKHLPPPQKFSEFRSLYRGRFLRDLKIKSDEFCSWVSSTNDKIDAIAGDVLTEAIHYYELRGDAFSALDAASSLISIDPLREDWQRLYLTLHARRHGRSSALAMARKFLMHLRNELDVDADPATLSLVRSFGHSRAV